jgi:hypothetical protein
MDSVVEMKPEQTPSAETAAEAKDAGTPTAAAPVVSAPSANPSDPNDAARPQTPSDPPVAHLELTRVAEAKSPAANVAPSPLSQAAAATPQLGDALAALDSRDYATARRLFEGLGRAEAAKAIDTALAALDRKDYATAHGLFEALATLKPGPHPQAPKQEALSPARPAVVPEPAKAALPEVQREAALPRAEKGPSPDANKAPPPLAVVPGDHRAAGGALSPAPRRRSRRFAAAAVLFVLALAGLAAFRPSRDWAFAAAEGPGRSGLASAVAFVETPLKAIGDLKKDRDAIVDLRSKLADATSRLEKLEQAGNDREARVDGLSARLDQGSAAANQDSAASAGLSSRVDQLEAKLDQADKRVAGLAASGSKAADAAATRVADVSARLDRLEKRADAATPVMPASGLAAHAIPSAPKTGPGSNVAEAPLPPVPMNRPTNLPKPPSPVPSAGPGPVGPAARLLGDYSVEDVQGGVALVDGRYGEQSVAPGDVIPGAGRVLRIERHGNEWFVVTSNGVIASNPAPF